MNRPDGSGPPEGPATLLVLGVPFHDVTEDEALAWIAARARSRHPSQLVTSNLDFLYQAWRDPEMHRIHFEADLVVADGWPPVLFSRFFGPRLRGRVAGSDLVRRLGDTARDHGLSVYALGGKPGVGEAALKILQERSPGLRIAGTGSPPLSPLLDMDHEGLRRAVAAAGPDLLLVAFGAPKQDKWIGMNVGSLGVPVAMGVGGSLDFIAGAQTRAPRWIQKIGLEWFWRLVTQPRRMFKRYSADFFFLFMMLFRLALLRVSPAGRGAPRTLPDASVLGLRGAVAIPLRPLARAEEAAAFCAAQEPTASDRILVLDLSGFGWLNSLELGAIARLARAGRKHGRPLLLANASRRVARLIRLQRLNRYAELPESAEAFTRRLEELTLPPEERATRWTEEAGALTVLLPEEFDREEARRAGEEFARRRPGSVVVDGRRVRYVDSAGLLFFKTARRTAGAGLSLRSFPDPVMDLLRSEGLDR
jgi:N-acetylglucosaminyldiphosphoundecaprenol N-acetyl-beta-D-mannosaminyltransferase